TNLTRNVPATSFSNPTIQPSPKSPLPPQWRLCSQSSNNRRPNRPDCPLEIRLKNPISIALKVLSTMY
ncbi:hypothetical protein SARC_12072, partial [Sphaeroforma arctica JP610]